MELEIEFGELRKIEEKRKKKWFGKSDQNRGNKGFFGKKPNMTAGSSSGPKGKEPATT